MAVVIATGITAQGAREVLGVDVGDSEDEAFWRGFLRSLKTRGLAGVRLVISDQHAGLVAEASGGDLVGYDAVERVGQRRRDRERLWIHASVGRGHRPAFVFEVSVG